jgi:rhodanese-related sulfurtransferase
MNLVHFAKYAILLLVIACIPTVAQLKFDGFAPPTAIPFGITITEVLKLPNPILWVDARPEDLFERDHIPKALNLNETNWDRALPQLFSAYQPSRTIIVYCSSGCSESEMIAAKIRTLGFENVLVLEGGFDAWENANHDL